MIRRATAADRLTILDMCRQFHAESGVALSFNNATAAVTIDRALSDANTLVLLLDVDGRARGMFAAAIFPQMFTAERVAQELVWWVEPTYRGRGAIAMLTEYETWARAKGCVAVNMVGLGGDPVTTRLYERNGYVAQERHFLKRL